MGASGTEAGDGLSRFDCSRGITLATLASMNECKWKGCQTRALPRLKQKCRCIASLTDSKRWRIDCTKADATGICIRCQAIQKRPWRKQVPLAWTWSVWMERRNEGRCSSHSDCDVEQQYNTPG
jgi:hypothetical protein